MVASERRASGSTAASRARLSPASPGPFGDPDDKNAPGVSMRSVFRAARQSAKRRTPRSNPFEKKVPYPGRNMRTPLGKSLTLRGCDRIYETNLGAKKGRFLRNELESPRRFESYETN